MRTLVFVGCSILLLLASHAAVLRPAPSFSWLGVGNKAQSSKSLRGQAVVLLVARSPRDRVLRKQLRNLEEVYQQFASKRVVFAVALKEGEGPIPTDIPMAVVNDGPGVASAFGAEDRFQIVIIGRDGNIDYQTSKVLSGERVRDVIQNAFPVQAEARR
ncbi:MAG TPA: hypothetical protein VF614_02495 [Chthoniobacteraceae bacterium]|jgi:hypothetical protein